MRFGALFISILMSHVAKSQVPNYHSEKLEVVADLGEYQAIGVAVNSDNRLFVGFPKRGAKYEYGLTEIIDGKRIPYPNTEWNLNTEGEKSFDSVQDLYVDSEDNLWVLDSKGGEKVSKLKLLKINTKTNQVDRVYRFEDLDKTKSALNDVRVDTDKGLAYLSDPGLAAIVVLDLKSGRSRVLMANSKYTTADPQVILSYEGRAMKSQEGQFFRSNVNSIALSKDNRYFYFKPINQYALYRIATEKLANTQWAAKDVLEAVVSLGNTVITHGMETDKNGNIYLTSSIDYSIKYIDNNNILHTLVQDKRILWPDSFGIGNDGYLYFSCAQLQNEPYWNNGTNKTTYPFQIYRVKMPH